MPSNPMNIMDVANYVQQQGDLGKQQGLQTRFNALAGQAYTAPAGAARNELMGQAVATDPSRGVALGTAMDVRDTSEEKQQTTLLKQAAGAAQYYIDARKTNDPAKMQGAQQAVLPLLAHMASLQGKPAPTAITDDMLPAMYKVIAEAQGRGVPDQKGVVLSAGGQLRNPMTGELIANNPAAPGNPITADFGVPGGTQKLQFNQATRSWEPIVAGGVAGAAPATPAEVSQPAGAGSTYAPSVPATLSNAVMQQESGGNPNAVSPAGAVGSMQIMPQTASAPGFGVAPAQNGSDGENQRVGQQYLSAMTQKYGGNTQLALAAYNAGPGRVDAALQQAGGDPQKAMLLLPQETQNYVPSVMGRAGSAQANTPIGFTPTKGDSGDTFTKNKKFADKLQAAGAITTPAEYNQVLTTGKLAQSDADVQLSSADERNAHGLATYAIQPASLGRGKTRAAVIARALEINPDYNQAQAKVAYGYLADLGKSGPTSIGGQVVSANTLLEHGGVLLDANNKLTGTGSQTLNKLGNAVAGEFGDTNVTNYNQAVNFYSQELGKLVKGGVANEGEVRDIIRDLAPSRTPDQRHQAILQAMEFLYGRVKSIEDRGVRALGSMAPDTSLLTAASQGILSRAYREAGQTPPTFQPPGDGKSYVRSVRGSQGVQNQPSAAQPASGGWSATRVD